MDNQSPQQNSPKRKMNYTCKMLIHAGLCMIFASPLIMGISIGLALMEKHNYSHLLILFVWMIAVFVLIVALQPVMGWSWKILGRFGLYEGFDE